MFSVEYENLIQEAQQHWETYGVGGTCNHGTHNLFLADVDGDSTIEIIVGGFTYNVVNGYPTSFNASLTIWSWNGQNIILEANHEWPGGMECVFIADVDEDGINDIFTGGIFRNETGSYGSLMVWNWFNGKMSLKAHYEGVFISSISVGDLDKDGVPEIITVGDNENTAKLCLWHLDHNTLILKENLKLDIANTTSATSVYVYDLNNDGEVEVVTGGYCGNLNDSKGQLCIWNWNGKNLSLKANEEWQKVTQCCALNIAGGILGNTMVNNLKVGDVDRDGAPDIVTGGFTYDGKMVCAQLRIWNWNENALSLKSGQEWATDDITEVMCISFGDVDADSRIEIVTGGIVAAYGSFKTKPSQAQLRIWSSDKTTLTLENSKDWTIGEGVCIWNTATADLDNDGMWEIVTSGCMSINRLCDPDMRIWSIQRTSGYQNPLFYVITVIVAAAAVSAIIFFALNKRK
jgi:hypothetical protein